jgi:hypothetical protein
VMENGISTFVLDATSKRKSKQSRICPLILTMSANATCSVAHRREGNNRVWFLSEEGKKLPKIIGAKWPLYLAEFDIASNVGLRKGSQYGTGAERGKLKR